MNVKDLIKVVDFEKLLHIHINRTAAASRSEPDLVEKLHTFLDVLDNLKPSIDMEYVLLGARDNLGVCRAFAVDMVYIQQTARHGFADKLPRSPHLGHMGWCDILGMEVCRENLKDVGCEALLEDLIRWMTNNIPLHEIKLLKRMTIDEYRSTLQPQMRKALDQCVTEYGRF